MSLVNIAMLNIKKLLFEYKNIDYLSIT